MKEMIARKTRNPELLLNLAQQYLECHEWGRARIVLEQLDKNSPTHGVRARKLSQDISQRLYSSRSQENNYEF